MSSSQDMNEYEFRGRLLIDDDERQTGRGGAGGRAGRWVLAGLGVGAAVSSIGVGACMVATVVDDRQGWGLGPAGRAVLMAVFAGYAMVVLSLMKRWLTAWAETRGGE